MASSSKQPLLLEATAASEATGWRRGQDLIDALPYIDTLNDRQKKEVEALLEMQMVTSPKTPADYLNELPPLPKSVLDDHPLLLAELERVAKQQPMTGIDVARYRLDPPSLTQRNDVDVWQSVLDNARSQLEHQGNRLLNLELLIKYGPNAWRANNEALDVTSKRLDKELAQLKKDIEAINQARNLQQLDMKKDLVALENEWKATIAKNVEIERACAALEAQILALRKEKGIPEQGEEEDGHMEDTS